MSAQEPVSAREPPASPIDCFRCVITVESPAHSPPSPSAHSPPSPLAHSPPSHLDQSPPSSPPLHQNGEPDESGRMHANGALQLSFISATSDDRQINRSAAGLAGGGKADAVSVTGVGSGAAGAGETKRRPPLTRGISRNKSDTNILPVILFARYTDLHSSSSFSSFLLFFLRFSSFFIPFFSSSFLVFIFFSASLPPLLFFNVASEPRPLCSR